MSEQISTSRVGRLLKSQTAIDFYGRRKIGFIAGIVIVVITLVSLYTQGLNLGLDFEGGNAWDVPASESFDIDEAEQVLSDNGIDLVTGPVTLRPAATASKASTGPRVGLRGDPDRPWRFWLDGEPTVSAYRPAKGL